MTSDLQERLHELDRLSALLDSKFRVPGTSIRFGFDTLLGLIPGLGDLLAVLPAVYLLYRGHQLGAGRRTMARMAMNTFLDLTIGAVPLVGDVFDLFFKANLRNVALLRRDLARLDPNPVSAV